MKKSLSPGVVVLVIAVVIIVIGLVFFKGTSGSRANQDDIKQAIMNQSGQGGTQAPMPNAPIPNKK